MPKLALEQKIFIVKRCWKMERIADNKNTPPE
jgi:hypothetical protein